MTEAARNFSVKDNVTPGGKALGVYKVANTSLYCIAFKNGGEKPKKLSGMWTDPMQAQRAIDAYITEKELEAAKPPAHPAVKKTKPRKKAAPKVTDVFPDDEVADTDGTGETE